MNTTTTKYKFHSASTHGRGITAERVKSLSGRVDGPLLVVYEIIKALNKLVMINEPPVVT